MGMARDYSEAAILGMDGHPMDSHEVGGRSKIGWTTEDMEEEEHGGLRTEE
jgi:hypothetical protein